MIIVKSNEGQLCNRMWSYTALIAHSFKFNEYILILDFGDYYHLFESLSVYSRIYFIKNKYQKKILNLILKLFAIFNLLSKFNISLKSKSIAYVDGWRYRSEIDDLKIYKNNIKKLFRPKIETINKCKEIINLNKKGEILIGVHMRRLDYKSSFNGNYYFDNSVYRDNMKNFKIQNPSKTISFLMCSDEIIDLNGFSEFDCFQIKSAKNIEDLYSLSLCDFIIGPPSTFSMWASFYGEVPLAFIRNDKKPVNLNEFKTVMAVDVFNDGTLFEHFT